MDARKLDPPAYLLIAMTAMGLLSIGCSAPRHLVFPFNLVGLVPLAVGIAANLAADRTFKRRGAPVKPAAAAERLVTDGIFSVSRNPMYAGAVLILVGLALLVGTLPALLVPLVFAVWIDRVFIRFEEDKLADAFGAAWKDYASRVRRWL